ncbi:uncharacterized protein LOC108477639 [Gossypium arboreum]|uniref:uncharacterized protein LOC108477639 n=1 Tax=Gossypium arboreum TaxID=29729 RepID=UPI00081900D5|nr:uncharacterized protein LOC108477639 [Gossypium arboreum]
MASSGFSPAALPVFNGEGYHIWVVKMKTYLQAFDLWEVFNSDVEPAPLRTNPTVAQIRQHADERTKRHKAMSCIQNYVSDVIFTRIMACETPKQAWDRLKEKFQGTERIRQQQLLNLRRDVRGVTRDFENLKMKEEETVKKYLDRIMAVINIIGLLGEQFSEAIIVEKSKEELADWRSTNKFPFKPKPSLPRALLLTKARRYGETSLSQILQEEGTNPAGIAKGLVIQRPISKAEARVAEEGSDHEEQVFAFSCSTATEKATKGWLINSGYTKHMTIDAAIFKTIDRSFKTKVKIRNGHFIKAEGKGDVLISTPTGNKLVSNVLLVPKFDKNLFSIAQLLEKGYIVVFKGKECQISYQVDLSS